MLKYNSGANLYSTTIFVVLSAPLLSVSEFYSKVVGKITKHKSEGCTPKLLKFYQHSVALYTSSLEGIRNFLLRFHVEFSEIILFTFARLSKIHTIIMTFCIQLGFRAIIRTGIQNRSVPIRFARAFLPNCRQTSRDERMKLIKLAASTSGI